MQKKYLLGFDVGTSESKGTLTDLEGHVLAIASAKHELFHHILDLRNMIQLQTG